MSSSLQYGVHICQVDCRNLREWRKHSNFAFTFRSDSLVFEDKRGSLFEDRCFVFVDVGVVLRVIGARD